MLPEGPVDPSTVRPPLSRDDLVKEIARDVNVPAPLVDLVLRRFMDIAVEEVVNHRSFPLKGLFSLRPYQVKGTVGPNGELLPPQERTRLKMSKALGVLIRLQREQFGDKPFFVNRDTWRGALKWALEQPRNPSEGTPRAPKALPQDAPADHHSPLLDDFLSDF